MTGSALLIQPTKKARLCRGPLRARSVPHGFQGHIKYTSSDLGSLGVLVAVAPALGIWRQALYSLAPLLTTGS